MKPNRLFLSLALAALAGGLNGCAHRPDAGSATPRLAELSQKLVANPDDPAALIDRGYVWCLLGDSAHAREDFKRALQLKPDDPVLRSRVGWALFNLGDFRGALACWEKAVELSKGKMYYDDYILAVGYWVNGDRVRAAKFYDQAVKRDERFGDAEKLAKRTETWTQKETWAIHAVYDLWRKTYVTEP